MLTQDLLRNVIKITHQAGEKIMSVYGEQATDINIMQKEDGSPLTKADLLAHQTIIDGLKLLTPDIPILSEESSEAECSQRHQWPTLWMVDPLDGTKEFIHRTDEFTVNIALIVNCRPVLGVVFAPALGVTYFAMDGHGAYKKYADKAQRISARFPITLPYQVVASRRHGGEALEKFLQQLPDHVLVNAGSALKICLVAEGVADFYPRLGPTSEWDTAAGHAIINNAGGILCDAQYRPFQYNMRNTLLNGSFIVSHKNTPRFDFC
ncbi:MAG: 3'(2'),5'-bisphosphate nucleotidase CysQ [Gammaproteobacteria bacterium]|nr:3'(2'),5'-bisphosphate nucleotidase CysQ [Gammaproteobacteria bacterium]